MSALNLERPVMQVNTQSLTQVISSTEISQNFSENKMNHLNFLDEKAREVFAKAGVTCPSEVSIEEHSNYGSPSYRDGKCYREYRDKPSHCAWHSPYYERLCYCKSS